MRRYGFTLLVAAAAAILLAPVATATTTGNLVRDGDFERPSAPAGSWTTYSVGSRIKRWHVVSGDVDLVGLFGPGDIAFQSATGAQSVDLAGSVPGAISQRVPTVASQSYTLRFAMAGNPSCAAPKVKHMYVSWNGARLARLSFDTTGHTPDAPGWAYHGFTVTATSGTTLVKFRAGNRDTDCGPTLDDVSIVPVIG